MSNSGRNKKILGIDLGTNSLGWAILSKKSPQDRDEMQFEDAGTVLFDEGVIIEKGNEKSKAAERTKYRSARRLIFRRKLRKYETLKALIRYGMVPLSLEALEAWRKSNFTQYPSEPEFINWQRTDDKLNKNPYYLRAKAVHEKLNPFDLGRVFYHLAQRRGFLSNRKEQKDDKEQGIVKENIDEITKKIKESGSKSLGEYFWKLYKEDRTNPENKIRDQYLGRKEHYEKEFELICQVQELPNEICEELYKAIFYQRPLRSQKGLVGNCVFEPKKPRVPVSRPEFEEFRMWSFINNIKIQIKGQDEKPRFLTYEEKERLIPLFENAPSKTHIKFKELAKHLIPDGYKKAKLGYIKSFKEKDAHILFNYPMNHSVSTSPVRALFKKYIGEDWETRGFHYEVLDKKGNLSRKKADYQDIWHALFYYEDETLLHKYFKEKLGFDEETAKKFVQFRLPQDYASLSLKAVNKILQFLRMGFTYDKAVFLAKIPEIVGEEIWEVDENQEKIIADVIKIIEGNQDELKLVSAINRTIQTLYKKGIRKYNTFQDKSVIESYLKDALEAYFGKNWQQKLNGNELLEKGLEKLLDVFPLDNLDDAFLKQDTLAERIKKYLQKEWNVPADEAEKLYHPSQTNIYPESQPIPSGIRFLKSPIVSSIKNPVMMRSLHMLKKLINHLLATGKIDNETVIHLELARDLNDANMRAAIQKYQREREKENQAYREEIIKLFQKQGIQREPSKEDIQKYRLWKEQGGISIYTGESIPLHELFDGTKYDIEHTVPRSLNYDNSLANKTVTESRFNREIKLNRLPRQLDNFEEIKHRLEEWKKKVDELKEKISKATARSKSAQTKEAKDRAIQDRHYYKMQLEYWQKKIKYFEIEEDQLTEGFKYSQLNDTRLITKYARAYLKSAFDIVHVVKGSTVAEFRKLWGLQEEDTKKDRTNHVHHAIDAVVIAAMTKPKYDLLARLWETYERLHLLEDKINILKNFTPEEREEYERLVRRYEKLKTIKPWETFTEDIKNLENYILVYHDFRDILPKHTRKKLRKRGKIQWNSKLLEKLPDDVRDKIEQGIYKQGRDFKIIEKNSKVYYQLPFYNEGDTARGVLHRETFYGAIARKDEKGNIIKNKNGEIEVDYVVRKYVVDLSEKDAEKIVDPVIRQIVMRDKKREQELNKQIDQIKKSLRIASEDEEKILTEKLAALETEKNKLYHLPTKKGDLIPIKKVRIITRVTEPIPEFKKHRDLSKIAYKQWYYVENKENYGMAVYEGLDTKANLSRDYKIIKNIEAAEFFKRSNQANRKNLEFKYQGLIEPHKNGLPLKYILKKGMTVLFYLESPEELKELSKEELIERLFVITELRKDGKIYFIPHQLGGEMSKLKKGALSKIIFDKEKMFLLSRKNWNFIVNGIEFDIDIDGEIRFRF